MFVELQVENDHLERESKTSPELAIAELVLNSLDADANRITVEIDRNRFRGIQAIRVTDDGHGIDHADAVKYFSRLGGSWKKQRRRSSGAGRILHGKDGRGRLKAFALGDIVRWETWYRQQDDLWTYTITGQRPELNRYEITDPQRTNGRDQGTTVTIGRISKSYTSLDDAGHVARILAKRLALNLRQYPSATVTFDGVDVDPAVVQSHSKTYPLPELVLSDGRTHSVSLTVIEWEVPTERALYLCDKAGFAFFDRPPGIQAPGWQFTAYLCCDFIQELDDQAALALGDLHPALDTLLNTAKDGMRAHFRERNAQVARDVVATWKREEVYPYDGEPKTPIETAERQVFDVVALQVNEFLPEFSTSDKRGKRLSLRLLRHAIEEGADELQMILEEVLELPVEKQADLAELLRRTSLAAIINASKVVADRLDFLKVLDILLYSAEGKEQTKERTHLHKLLEPNTWIFGEEFALSVSDQSLDQVLAKYIDRLDRDRDEVDAEAPVRMQDGGVGIIDLMLSRTVPQARPEEQEHLIVELKRPNVRISPNIITKVIRYATAVADDERFRDLNTRWTFWALSNDLTADAKVMARQKGRPRGLVHDDDERRLQVWVKPWSAVLQACRGRMVFYQKHLEYDATDESALEAVRRLHGKYLPAVTPDIPEV